MRCFSIFVRSHFRAIAGALAATALVIAGTYAFACAVDPRAPTAPGRPGMMLPVLIEPLSPSWTTPSPPR
ncbi:hypothetical protein GCM10027167_85900 [Nocardia heshunensis]